MARTDAVSVPDAPPGRRSWARLGLPLGVSILVHAALLTALAAIAINFRGLGERDNPGGEVFITLNPPRASADAPATSAPGVATATPRATSSAPRLEGLTSAPAAAPLRSGLADPAGALRRGEPVWGGATFAGLGARQASSVVYVVDASGAMLTSLPFVLAEVERSINALSPAQQFQVVLFRDRPAENGGVPKQYDVFGDGTRLLPATNSNKQAVGAWLREIKPVGRSNPLDGLRRGLELAPDAVFLLSRSIRRTGGADTSQDAPGGVWGKGVAETLAELDRLNPRGASGHRRVVIKAVQFLEEDPTGTMQAIGEAHGDGPGAYRVITLKDLGGS